VDPFFQEIVLSALGLLAVVSLPQLVWTRRIVDRLHVWLANPRQEVELATFTSFSRAAQWGWLIGIVLAFVVAVDSQLESRGRAWQSIPFCAGVTFWCLIQWLISAKSHALCQQVLRFMAVRQMDAAGFADAAQLLPSSGSPPVTEESLRQRLSTLGRVSLIWMICLLMPVAVAGLIAVSEGLDAFASATGQLLLMFTLIALPGVIALVVVRYVVEARARRAQFLWFLAATTQNRRPLASELMAWGRSHPGRYGSRVMEVARDISVGESLSDALTSQNGLLNPSDLMSVRVAEQTGTLAETLRDCATRQTQALKGDAVVANASGTAVWLWTVVVVAVTITSFLMYYIVPKFKAIFMGFGTELPGITVLLINLSDMFVKYAFLWLPLFSATSLVLLWSCGEAFLRGWSETVLAWRLGFGRKAEVPRLLRRLRGAVVSKLPWTTALQPMVLKHPQADIRSRLERVLGRVTAGMAVWPAMRDSGLLSPRDVSLLEMAERANNLAWALDALAESKERSLRHRWQVCVVISVPMFTIMAGLAVWLICIGFFMPLVKLLNDLS
jgi:type II secretory pathway component PulF